MTKWARMRRRRERKRAEESLKSSAFEENASTPAQIRNDSDNANRSRETQKLEIHNTSKSNSILSQIPTYVYLVAIFTLLSSIFFPLITTGADAAYSVVIGGTATLFVGLAGGILLFKATTSIKRRGVFLVVGFALIGISLALIFLVQEWWKLEFMRS